MAHKIHLYTGEIWSLPYGTKDLPKRVMIVSIETKCEHCIVHAYPVQGGIVCFNKPLISLREKVFRALYTNLAAVSEDRIKQLTRKERATTAVIKMIAKMRIQMMKAEATATV